MNLSSARRLIGCVLLVVAACATRDGPARSRELDQCRVASHSGDELTRCTRGISELAGRFRPGGWLGISSAARQC